MAVKGKTFSRSATRWVVKVIRSKAIGDSSSLSCLHGSEVRENNFILRGCLLVVNR